MKLCQSTASCIVFRCAGLLEITWAESDENTLPNEYLGEETDGDSWLALKVSPTRATVNFIHRSARDFLCDTDAGEQILSFCLKSDEEKEIDFTRSYIANSMLLWSMDRSCGDTEVHEFEGNHRSERIINHISKPNSAFSESVQFELLDIFRKSVETIENSDPSLSFL